MLFDYVNLWDPILVFLYLQRLPKYSVTLWEDLDHILTERIQTLICLRDIWGIDNAKPYNH